MRARCWYIAPIVFLALSGGCKSAKRAAPAPDYQLGTIKDLMDSVVEPNADYLWDSVSTESTARGVVQNAPKTDSDWDDERHHAIALMEATNLIQMPGRHVAHPGEKADNPDVEEAPEEIEALIASDRAVWYRYAHNLYDATAVMTKAVDARDPAGILNAGESLDEACEQCHVHYWYPHENDNTLPSGAGSVRPGAAAPIVNPVPVPGPVPTP